MDAGDRAELAERWRAEARDYRYNGDQIYAMALARSRERSSPIERGILDRKSIRLNSSHSCASRMPSTAGKQHCQHHLCTTPRYEQPIFHLTPFKQQIHNTTNYTYRDSLT